MARIVLIHGIAQEQRTADSLEEEWLPALAGGVRTAGYPEIADSLWRTRHAQDGIEARMAFYGHLFLTKDQQGAGAAELTLTEEELSEQLALLWLQRAAARATNPREQATAIQELAYAKNELGPDVQGHGRYVRQAIRGLARLRWFAPFGMGIAERFVMKSLVQVGRYLSDESTRTGILSIAKALVGPDTQIIIGHSLGSVVAYELAHLLEGPLPLLMTLGSPLGLDAIIYPRLRPQPPHFPQQVLRWVNIADPDDFVAAEPDLSKFFSTGLPTGAIFEGAYTVDNGAKPHSGVFYLGKAQTGLPIGQVLSNQPAVNYSGP
jgi:hypothetical protein